MGLYTAAHVDPQSTGDARPTALQIIRDESVEGKLAGKVMVITGTSSGIGIETARALAATGATLFLTARNLKTAETVLADILEPGRVSLVEMDNTSFASVRAAAATILAKSENQVNILVNNAGVIGVQDLQLTADGYEIHFATNHLSHFLLFELLKPALLASSTPEFHSRVVNVGSSAHRAHGINNSDNYNFEKGDYHFMTAYAQSKMANTYMTNEIDRRYGSKGLHATSIHPGNVHTNAPRHMGPEFMQMFYDNEGLRKSLKSIEQGAATTVIAAIGKEWENKGGKYLENCEEAPRGVEDEDAFKSGYVNRTYDQAQEERLWKDSLKIVGLKDDRE